MTLTATRAYRWLQQWLSGRSGAERSDENTHPVSSQNLVRGRRPEIAIPWDGTAGSDWVRAGCRIYNETRRLENENRVVGVHHIEGS